MPAPKLNSSAHRRPHTNDRGRWRGARFTLAQARLCRECHGHGLVWIDGTPDLCPACEGSGERW